MSVDSDLAQSGLHIMSYSCQTTIIVGKIKSQQSPAELPVNWTLDQSWSAEWAP